MAKKRRKLVKPTKPSEMTTNELRSRAKASKAVGEKRSLSAQKSIGGTLKNYILGRPDLQHKLDVAVREQENKKRGIKVREPKKFDKSKLHD